MSIVLAMSLVSALQNHYSEFTLDFDQNSLNEVVLIRISGATSTIQSHVINVLTTFPLRTKIIYHKQLAPRSNSANGGPDLDPNCLIIW